VKLSEKEDFIEDDLKELINSKTEESINIEFKASGALSMSSGAKKEISKDVSSFANSDGGIISYGINEENHVASSFSFIDGNLFTKEWLENVISSNIQQPIRGLLIYPVRVGGKIEQTVYVVKIPRSDNAPHMNSDKKYYRRYNFQSVPMEEYEIRNLYLTEGDGELYFNNITVKLMEQTDEEFEFYIEMTVINEGHKVANNYKAFVEIKGEGGFRFSHEREKSYTITNHLGEGVQVSTNKMIPIFPDEVLNLLSFNLIIPKDRFTEITSSINCKFSIKTRTYLTENTPELSKLLFEMNEKHFPKEGQYR
jgi:hypothetical protein